MILDPTPEKPAERPRKRKPNARSSGRCGILVLAVLFFGILALQAAPEYEIKAAYLYNFANFVIWPGEDSTNAASSPIVIGVVGVDPFGETLKQTVAGERIRGRPIEIRHFEASDSFKGCHLLFISRSEDARLKDILERAHANSVLTVSESEEFFNAGGMINFVQINKNIRFDINTAAMSQAGLRVSSKLLSVAHTLKK